MHAYHSFNGHILYTTTLTPASVSCSCSASPLDA